MPIIWYPASNSVTATPTVVVTPIYGLATTTAGSPWASLAGMSPTTLAQMDELASWTQTVPTERDSFGLGNAQLSPRNQEQIARAAILRHQEEARRDEALYARALAEHNEQEAARIRRVIEERELTAAARRQALDAQQAQAQQEVQRRQAANDRARELLLENLNPAQRDTFTQDGWFIVEGGRTRTKYRIHGGRVAGNIDVLRQDGRVRYRLCCHARDSSIPHGDHHLSQKIMLELAEDDFLRMANRHAA